MSASKIINKTNALTPNQKQESSQLLLWAHHPVAEIEHVAKAVQISLQGY